jgi:predicted transcriptional regulator
LPKSDFRPTEYKIGADDQVGSVLGPLESEVMETVWQHGDKSFTVREIYEDLKRTRKIAYTTVMTTMTSLFNKGLLTRNVTKGKGGLLYLYKAKMSRKDLEKETISNVLRSLWQNFGKETLTSSFIDEINIEPHDLERLLEKERPKDTEEGKGD